MAQQAPPIKQYRFGGVVTSGHRLQRPATSSIRCKDFRIMPGGYLRIRGGRTQKIAPTGGGFYAFHEFEKAAATPAKYHICLWYDGVNNIIKWRLLNLGTYTLSDLETVSQTYGFSIGAAQVYPIASVRNKVFWGNGLGVRAANSTPALSSWDGSSVRYVGLDAYINGTAPTLTFAAGAGFNQIIDSVTVYVGVYNSVTGHYSNGVLVGKYTNTTGATVTGTLTVNNASSLTLASHGSGESAELSRVFYASVDGGATAYLILKADLTGPFTSSSGTVALSLAATPTDLGDQGFTLDLTQERPIDNHPPRPMSQICYANGRVYGILSGGGSGTSYRDFQYEARPEDFSAIVWSAAADDYTDRDFVGVPEEAWPLKNKKFTPNGEMPLIIAQATDRGQLLVITRTATFLLNELADGLHEWITISKVDGLWTPTTFVNTPNGPMWVTQNRQIVRLNLYTFQIAVMSNAYSELLSDPTYASVGATADYLRDPEHQIEQYQVWRNDGSRIVHDFVATTPEQPDGQGYEYSFGGIAPITCRTMVDLFGQVHHLMADSAIYCQEADPVTRKIPTRDQTGVATFAEVTTGDYISQWMDYGDPELRKEIRELTALCDAGVSTQLGVSPLVLSTYIDFGSTEQVLTLFKRGEVTGDKMYGAKVPSPHRYWFKFRIRLAGHSADGPTTEFPVGDSNSADLPPNFYGLLPYFGMLVNPSAENR